MEKGSLVKFKDGVATSPNPNFIPYIKRFPKKNEILTVREIFKDPFDRDVTLIRFEEFEMGINPISKVEFGVPQNYFVEVQHPTEVNIAALIDQTKTNLN